MDTVLQWKNLTLPEALLKLTLICVFVLCPNVLAEDLRLAHLDVAPQVSFDDTVSAKYSGANIANVTQGVKHIKMTKYYGGKPVRINVIEADLGANDLQLTPVLAAEKLPARRTITTIAKNSNAIVALNGTYFKPQTGVPLGTLMIDGKLLTGPVYDRVAMGIMKDGFDMARVQLDASIKSGDQTIKVDNLNQPRMLANYVLVYTPEWGAQAPQAPKGCKSLAISDSTVTESSQIPSDGFVVVGPAAELNKISKKARLSVKTTPDWQNVKHIISGGPYLVKDGEVFVDTAAQRLGAIGGRAAQSVTPRKEL